jgi:hypothetical protein
VLRPLLAIAVLAAAVIAAAQSGLMALLSRSRDASYAGVRSVQIRRGDRLVEFDERVLRRGPESRIEHPPGSPFEGQIIVESGRNRFHYLPKEGIIRKTPKLAERMMPGMAEIGGRFAGAWSELSGEEVAGRKVRVFQSPGEGSIRVWADAERGVILAREAKDREGRVLGSFRFRALKFNPAFAGSEFKLDIPGVRVVSVMDELREAAASLGLQPPKLRAPGFELVGVRRVNSESVKALILQFRRDDDRVTLACAKTAIEEGRLKKLVPGRVNVHLWSREGQHYALVSGLSAESLRWLARRVEA